MKIVFLGGGNMAAALIGGMLERGFAASEINVVELDPPRREWLVGEFGVGVAGSADLAVCDADVLVLAVKPQQMREALQPLAGRLGQTLLISIAAGLRIADLARWAGGREPPRDAFRRQHISIAPRL